MHIGDALSIDRLLKALQHGRRQIKRIDFLIAKAAVLQNPDECKRVDTRTASCTQNAEIWGIRHS